jgi:hypothetical protein
MQSSLRFGKITSLISFPHTSPLEFPCLRSCWFLAVVGWALFLCISEPLRAEPTPTTHTLILSNATETVDEQNRLVIVSNVQGDIPGVLTLALIVGPDGLVRGGEWALTVSYIQFGPPDSDGDGDLSESLVQRGVIKGAVSAGSSFLAANGLASELSGIVLNVTGATLEFTGKNSGTGTVTGRNLNQSAASSGTLTITF